MPSFNLHITLDEAVIFSQDAATLGGHRTLDYIPGSALLGACAAALYQRLGTQSFAVFHAGKVRFGNAYPLSHHHAMCRPMPFAWFYPKGAEYKDKDNENNRLKASAIYNLKYREADKPNQPYQLPDNKQPKQLRGGYISDDLYLVTPKSSLRMKTAINPDTARAADSQLFGYQALEAQQVFVATIDIDESIESGIDATTTQLIKQSMTGTLFLGRSRSAQWV